MFGRVLIANRGEIAVRVMRTCRRLGIESVAVYSDADRDALHVASADRAVHIGDSRATESYLRVDKIVEAAVTSGAEAVHPGYGFLSENPALAEACAAAGIAFVGPSAQAIRSMGSKAEARRIAREYGVPCVPGYDDEDQDLERLLAAATRGTSRAPRRVEHGCAAGRRRIRTWVASAMSDAVLWTTATHSRFCATTTATTSGDEATTSSGARWTSYSNG